jgi:hypothetical protein
MPATIWPRAARRLGRVRRLVRRTATRMANSGRAAGPTPRSSGDPAGARTARVQAVRAGALADTRGDAGPASPPSRPGARFATLVGPRLGDGLGPEVTCLPLLPGDGADRLDPTPDLLLVELAGGRVPGWSHAPEELAKLVARAGELGCPVLVWVTDDWAPAGEAPVPVIRELLDAAHQVLVPAEGAVAAWQSLLPDATVRPLRPAAQQRRQLPRPGGGQAREAMACLVLDPPSGTEAAEVAVDPVPIEPVPIDPVLAGTWPASVASLLDVWPLDDGTGRARPVPAGLAARAAGPIDMPIAAAVPARYRVLLDAGRAAASATWTVLAAGAAQTAVVTSAAAAAFLPPDLAERVTVVNDPQDVRGELAARINQCELRDREALRLHRAVLAGHTFGHRVDDLLAAVGRPAVARDRSVSAVVPTNREHELGNILANLGRQAHPDVQLVLVLHGLDVDRPDLRARAAEAGVRDLVLVPADPATTLGSCMNLGVDAADGRYVAKMDDDNHYGAHYLTDLVAAFDYTRAGIVGKWAHYVWLRSSGAVVLRHAASEHAYERRVQGGSMLFDGDLVRRLRFSDIPRAVDTDILDRALADGVQVYSTDRFNYVSIRGADRHAHTWTVADHTFMTRTGHLTFFGDPREHVAV